MDQQSAPAEVAEGTDMTAPLAEEEAAAEATEAPAAEAAKPPAVDKHAARFAALARKERAIREAEAKAKAERDAVEARAKEFESKRAELAWLDEVKTRPTVLLEKFGPDLYKSLTEAILRDGEPDPKALAKRAEEKALTEVEKVNKRIEELQRQIAEREAAAEQERNSRIISQIQADVTQHLAAHADDYELTIALGQQEEVFKLIHGWAEDRGELLPVKKAAEMVEDFYTEQAKRAASTKKLRTILAPAEQAAAPKAKSNVSDKSKPSALTNNVVASPAVAPDTRRMTREEREQAALEEYRKLANAGRK